MPTAGSWPVLTSSSITRSIARRGPEQIAVTAGWFDVGTDPTKSWLHLQLTDRVVDLTVVDIADDPYELSAWHLSGVADFPGGEVRQQPVQMTLRYHGVYRRGTQKWAWFSGTAVVGDSSSRRKPAERLVLDLLFESR